MLGGEALREAFDKGELTYLSMLWHLILSFVWLMAIFAQSIPIILLYGVSGMVKGITIAGIALGQAADTQERRVETVQLVK